MKKFQDLFAHTYIDNSARKMLVTLHGTGGDENSFLFLNEPLKESYNILGLRGNVDENGMNRFFRRMSFGDFDMDSMKEETDKLNSFLRKWIEKISINEENIVFLGYSNGATMLTAMLFQYPKIMKKTVLLHPMLPYTIKDASLDLQSNKVFLSYGVEDPIIHPSRSKEAARVLSTCGSQLTVKEYPFGHEIKRPEVLDVLEFLKSV